jgi:all-trans-retinol dehydrogenase (NAD+)
MMIVDDVYYYKCDLADTAAITSVAAKIRERFGNPSVLINNAGIGTLSFLVCLAQLY